MKKLLLKLAALALFALSPHTPGASAQTSTGHMDFQLRTETHNTDLKIIGRYDKDLNFVDETLDWLDSPLYFSTSGQDDVANGKYALTKNNTAKDGYDKYCGIAKLENSDMTIEFDYTNALVNDATVKELIKNRYTTSPYLEVDPDYSGKKAKHIRIFPGVKIKITPKKNKPISKIKITSFKGTNGPNNTTVKYLDFFNKNVTSVTPEAFKATDATIQTGTTDPLVNQWTYLTSIQPENLFGENVNEFVFDISRDKCISVYQGSLTDTKLQAANTMVTYNNYFQHALSLMAIDIEYFEGEAPAFVNENVVGLVSDVKYWDKTASKWVVPTKTAFTGENEKFKMGDVITEFRRTAKSPSGKPTVSISLLGHSYLGAHYGTEFRSYMDPSIKYKGGEVPVYKADYFVQYNLGTGNYAYTTTYRSAYNLGDQSIDGAAFSKQSSNNNLDDKWLCTLDALGGINDKWVTVKNSYYDPMATTPTSAPATVTNGTLPAVVFEKVVLTAASETKPAEYTGKPYAPVAPTIPAPAGAVLQPGGALSVSEATDVTPTVTTDANFTDGYSDLKLYYILSETPIEKFDRSKATLLSDSASIKIASKGTLYVVAVGEKDGVEYESLPAAQNFDYFTILPVTSYTDLLKPENAGKIVRIDYITKVLNAGSLYQGTNSTQIEYIGYLFDKDGNPFKLTSVAPKNFKAGGTDSNLLPKSVTATTSNAANTWTTDKFIGAETVVGKLTFVKGKPVIQIMDRVGEDQFDYWSFCSTAAALTAANAGVTSTDFQHYVTTKELKPEHWGKLVVLNNTSGFNRDSKTVKENGTGNTVQILYGPDERCISNYYMGYSNAAILKEGGADENDVLSFVGVVDFDEETDDYTLMIRNAPQYDPIKPSKVQALTGTNTVHTELEAVEAGEGFDLAFEGLVTNGLNWRFDRAGEQSKLTTAYYAVLDYNGAAHKQLGSFQNVTLTTPLNGNLNNYAPTYDENGIARIAIVAKNTQLAAFAGITPICTSDTLFVSVKDYIRASKEYASIAELTEAYAGKTEQDFDKSSVTRISNPKAAEKSEPGEMVVIATGEKYLAVRDTVDFKSENVMILYAENGVANFKRYRYKGYSSGYKTLYRAYMPGDAVSRISGMVTFKDGNMITDITSFNNAQFNTGGRIDENYIGEKTPIYIDHIGDGAWTETVDKPEERKFTTSDLNHLVKLENLTVKITGDAASEEGENVTATTATPLALTWDYFLTTDEADSHKALVRQAKDDAKFIVEGIVLNDGKGGVRLEVLSLSITPDRVSVCYHEGHDSYFTGFEFKADQADRLVEARGAKLRRVGEEGNYTYQIEIKTPVGLIWTADMATQKTAHLKLIEDIIVGQRIKTDEDGNPLFNPSGVGYLMEDIGNFDGNPDLSTMMYNISGFLRVAEDGTQTIEVMDLKALNKAAFRTRLFAYGRGSADISFGGVSEATISAVTNGNLPTSGAERYKFYYKAATAPFEEVRRRVDAGEKLVEIGAEYLKDVKEKPYDMDNKPVFTESYFFSAYACAPGQNVPAEISNAYIEKVPTDVQTLDELITAKNEHKYVNWSGTTTSGNFLMTNPMRVIGVNNAYGYAAVTDGKTIVGMRARRTLTEELKPGDYIDNAYVTRQWHKNFYNVQHDAKMYLKPGSVPETEIAMPEHKVITDFNVEGATAVKMPAARIAKVGDEYMVSFAADAATPAALADEADADATPTALPITSHLGWTPEDLDEDAEYVVYGVVMPRTTFTDPNAPTYDPETDTEIKEPTPDVTKLELWATSVVKRSQTPAPVITVTGAESVEDGKAVTIEDVTVSIACEEATAKIEYSTDGGNTWTAYDATKPVVIKTTTTVAARAQGEDMSMSATVTMEIVRETLSGKAAIDFAPKAGYTEVTLRHEAIDFAGKYEVRYTTDGSEPTAASALYDPAKPLELEEACTIKAILKEEGKDRFGAAVSEAITVRSGDLTITATRAPGKTTVRIEVADTKHFNADGAVIYYSRNDGATFDEYQVAGGKNYVEFETDKAITVVAYLEEQGKTIGDDVAEDITVDPATTGPTDPEDPTNPTDPTDPEDPEDPTGPTDPDDPSAIGGIAADGSANVTVEGDCIVAPEGSMVFDMTGRRVKTDGLRAGIYIVRLADGTAVKVAVR